MHCNLVQSCLKANFGRPVVHGSLEVRVVDAPE